MSETVEGRERYPINVRYAREFRDDPGRARARAGRDAGRRAGAALAGRRHRVRARAADDPQRGRQARRLRLRRHRSPDRRLRRRRASAVVAREVELPAGHAPRVGRPVQVLRARQGAPEVGRPADARLVFLLLYFNTRLGRRDGDRDAGGAVLAGRRGLAAVPARLQPERRGVGRASSRWPGSTPRPAW